MTNTRVKGFIFITAQDVDNLYAHYELNGACDLFLEGLNRTLLPAHNDFVTMQTNKTTPTLEDRLFIPLEEEINDLETMLRLFFTIDVRSIAICPSKHGVYTNLEMDSDFCNCSGRHAIQLDQS
jgi:hypothetical protein